MRPVVILCVMLTSIAAPSTAQEPLVVTDRAAMILMPVKPDSIEEFEVGLAQVRAALAETSDPIKKQQARGWSMFRAEEPIGANVLYVFVIDPAVPFADYSFKRILTGSLPADEVEAAFRRLYDSLAGPQSVFSMKTQAPETEKKTEKTKE